MNKLKTNSAVISTTILNNIDSILTPRQAKIGISSAVFGNTTQNTIEHSINARFANRMNIIRVLSMCSIIWRHTLLGWEDVHVTSGAFFFIQALFIQLGKLGTINFFVISGYFLCDKLESFTIWNYLRSRFFRLIIPWLVFLFLFVAIELIEIMPPHQTLSAILKLAFTLGVSFLFHSAYWFVPVCIFSAIVLIACKKFINNKWFGLMLLAFSLFYGINLYFGWVAVSHTKAVMGYIFFMWLGIQLKQHLHLVAHFLNKINWNILLPLMAICLIIACFEGIILRNIIPDDAFSTLRISNLVLSTFIFIPLLKSKKMNWLNKLDPRNHAYGIYLAHCIVISQLTPVINAYISKDNQTINLESSILLEIAFFIVTLSVTYFIVKSIKNSPLKFIIGL